MTFTQACRRLKAAAPETRRRLLDKLPRPGFAEALVAEARAAMASEPQEGPDWASLAVATAERGDDLLLTATAWLTLAQTLRIAGRHAEALPAFDAAASAAQAGGDPGRAAQVQLGRIDSLDMLGRTDEALAHAALLEETLRRHGLGVEAAKARVNAGNILFRRDRYADALASYEQALPTLEGGDPLAVASVQANCANILTFLGRADEALALYAQARAAFAGRGLAPAVAKIEANEAFLEAAAGRYVRALSALTRARGTFAALGQALETAKCEAEIADVYRALNLWPEAEACYSRAIPALEGIPLPYEAARAEMGRAVVWARQGRAEAEAALERAAAAFQRQKNGVQGAHVRLLRATLAFAAGRAEEAAAEAAVAARDFSRLGLPGWAAEARFLSGAATPARLHGIRRAALRHGRAWLACRADQALGKEYGRRGDYRRAVKHLRAAASALDTLRGHLSAEELHVAFLDDKLSVYEDLVTALLARGTHRDSAEAFETVERAKARLLLERVQTAWDREADAPATSAGAARLGTLRTALARAYHGMQSLERMQSLEPTGLVDGGDLPALEEAYREALREHEMVEMPGPLRHNSAASLTGLQEALPREETLVEFFTADGWIGAFVLTSRGLQAFPCLARTDEVAHIARRLRFQLQRAGSADGPRAALAPQIGHSLQGVLQCLHRLLLAPLRGALKTEKVVIIPHGLIHGLPFPAFHDGWRPALDEYEFAFAPSAALWQIGARRAALPDVRGGHILLMGVPDGGLAHVAEEIRALEQSLPGAESYCGAEATRAVFQARAEGARWIHLATHALFRADNPLFSGLRFADDWLLARDLYGMTLHADLVTLAACRTGVARIAPGDEPFGLVRGFLGAGVRALAVSLWQADDAATARLMPLFYSGLTSGLSRAAALRHAQRTLCAQDPNPYHWAPFILVGER